MKNAKVSFVAFLVSVCFASTRCTPDTTGVIPSTEAVLIRNIWSVDYFFYNQDMTNDFGSSRILFSSTGAVGYQRNGETIPGTWSKTLDASNNEILSIHFNTTDANIVKLNESWKVTSRSTNSLQLEENSGGSILFRLRTQ
jgi:hypothetical protein